MKKTRRQTSNDRCPKCRINQRLCFCAQIPSLSNKIELKIVMHYSERWLTSNTAYFANLVLDHSKIIERGNIDQEIPKEEFTDTTANYIYLFPTGDSKDLSEFVPDERRTVLVVPDGSWSKARKIHKREEAFHGMPKYHLSNIGVSNYKLRKSPGENFLCTYEAIAKSFGILESLELEEKMLNFFDIFVSQVLKSRHGDIN